MPPRSIKLFLDTRQINDWDSFHDMFTGLFGFSLSYSRTMDAWLEHISHLDDPNSGMTSFHLSSDEMVSLYVLDTAAFAKRCPEQSQALDEYLGPLNERAILRRGSPLLSLVYR